MAKYSSDHVKRNRKSKNSSIHRIVSHIDWYMCTWCEKSQPDRVLFTNSEIFRVSGCLISELSNAEQSNIRASLWGLGYDASISANGDIEVYGWIRK